VSIEVEAVIGDQPERYQGGDGLADRRSLNTVLVGTPQAAMTSC
jgi:hypothetical protein